MLDMGKDYTKLLSGKDLPCIWAWNPKDKCRSSDHQRAFNNERGLRAELILELPDISGAVLVPTIALSERYEDFWLTRENGQQVPVVFLRNGTQGISRVQSPKISPGDRFRIKQER